MEAGQAATDTLMFTKEFPSDAVLVVKQSRGRRPSKSGRHYALALSDVARSPRAVHVAAVLDAAVLIAVDDHDDRRVIDLIGDSVITSPSYPQAE